MSKVDSICWDCANCMGKCPWSANFEPIPNWEATQSKVYQSPGVYVDSFVVHKCPMFKTDTQNSLVPITSEQIATALGISRRQVTRIKRDHLIKRCKDAKLDVIIQMKNGKRQFFYKRSIPSARYIPIEVAKLFRVDEKDTAF